MRSRARCPWRIALIASAFYPPLSRALVRGATDVLIQAGVARSQLQVVWAPGAFELPLVAQRLLRRHPRPDAVVALGALIRGDTPQYEVIAHAVAAGLMRVSLTTGVPVTFGVIVATSMAQAKARAGARPGSRKGRAGGSHSHRGAEAARAALDVLQTLHDVK